MRPALGLAVVLAFALHTDLARPSTDETTTPTGGRLVTRDGGEVVDVPLAHTDVRLRIDGHLAEATVTQTFRNPYEHTIEAVYMFPLPTDAAVGSLAIELGGRRIEGDIKQREDAVRVYERAKKRGNVAALLTQERPNLFTQSVANIEPGAQIDVELTYVHAMPYTDGGYEVVFPMVAGPRYVPAGSAQAADAPKVQPSVLPPGMRSSHDIGLFVEVDAGVSIESIQSPSHQLEITRDLAGHRAAISLADGDTIPNKDFVLRWTVAGDAPEIAVLAHRDGNGDGSFVLIAQPPADAAADDVAPREIVFVLDTSSSMAGEPLDKAKQVIRRVLGGLRPDDTFQIVRFDDGASALGPDPIANKPRNLRYVYEWLDALDAQGGTAMTEGIEAALAIPHDPLRLRIVAFLTDGYIGNEDEILRLVDAKLGESRLFSFGVGSAVNRYLLEEMASLGRGAAQFVRPDEDTDTVVDRFYQRIDRAVLTDLRVDWGGLAVTDAVPDRMPDLFVGQPLVLAGHYTAPGSGTVEVRGTSAGREVRFEVPVTLPARRDRPAVASVWARRRIGELSRRLLRRADDALVANIVELSLAHRVLTRYTAFVAVDTSRVVDHSGGEPRTVAVPVEVPDKVRRVAAMSSGYGGMGVVGYGGGGGVGYGTIGIGSYGAVGKGAAGDADAYGGMIGSEARAVSAPQVRIGTTTVRGDLDKLIIRRYIRKHLNAVKYCYEKQLLKDPQLAGTVTVSFTLGGTGRPLAVTASGMGNETVESCVAEVIRKVQFPQTDGDGVSEITYPFVFKRSE
jgi:Ca-activated chloride channel family protein